MALTKEGMKSALRPKIDAALRDEFGEAIAADAKFGDQVSRLAEALAEGVADGVVSQLTDESVTQVVAPNGTPVGVIV